MKKNLIIFVALLNIVSFGSVSSAHAFIDPASLTLILGAAFITAVAGSEAAKHAQEESAQVQDQKGAREKVPVQDNRVTETGMNLAPSGS